MSERDARIWLVAAGFGVLFALLSAVNLAVVDGDATRDLVGVGLGTVLALLGVARARGWKGARR